MLILVAALAAVGCSSGAQGPDIAVKDVWGRPSPQAATNAAFYMVIENSGNEPDRLVNASSPACTVTELHEMYMKDGGVMGMRPVEGGFIEIPAKGSVELKPGGMHVMCIDRKQDFLAGTTIPVELTFEKSGTMTFEAEIRQS